jgi:excisionase family DNA binding protein
MIYDENFTIGNADKGGSMRPLNEGKIRKGGTNQAPTIARPPPPPARGHTTPCYDYGTAVCQGCFESRRVPLTARHVGEYCSQACRERAKGESMHTKYLTLQEVADRLRVHRDTAAKLVRSGVIRAHKFGVVKGRGHWRVSEDALKEYIESLEKRLH